MFNNINKKLPLIVEGCLNISYIDNLFVALFYKPSFVQNILSNEVEDLNSLHLQNMIYYYFVNNVRIRNVINSQTLNEIRNFSVFCGWKNNQNFIELFDINEYYDFLIEKFCHKKITLKNNDSILFSQNYITFNVNKNDDIKILTDTWIDNNFGDYRFDKIPDFIPIFLNRKSTTGKLNDDLIDIKKAISFKKNNDETQKDTMWLIHSIICYAKNDKQHYYSIINDNNEWFLYSSLKIPSLVKIDIKDEDISYKIKKECVFLLYTLQKS